MEKGFTYAFVDGYKIENTYFTPNIFKLCIFLAGAPIKNSIFICLLKDYKYIVERNVERDGFDVWWRKKTKLELIKEKIKSLI